jgi:hypothetical protein
MCNVTSHVQGALVFSSYDGGLQATEGYAGRISLVSPDTSYGKGSINLTNIRESDGGWYECSVFFPNRTPSTRPNGTWFHLSVEGNRVRLSVITALTSACTSGGTVNASRKSSSSLMLTPNVAVE